jgi:hypothetical protein
MSILTVIVTALAGLLFLAASVSKLSGASSSEEMRTHLGVPAGLWKLIGGLELAGVAGLVAGTAVEAIAVAASGGLALLSLGALASHGRVRDPLTAVLPAVLGLVLSAATTVLLLA